MSLTARITLAFDVLYGIKVLRPSNIYRLINV